MSRSFARAILRWSLASILLFGFSSGDAFAQGAIGGNWTGGSFTCGTERPRRMTLTLEERGGALSGTLSAEIAPNSPERLTYRVRGTFTGSTFSLQPEPGQRMVPGSEISNVEGTFDAARRILRGSSACLSGFERRKRHMIDVAVQGLVHSEHKPSHTTSSSSRGTSARLQNSQPPG